MPRSSIVRPCPPVIMSARCSSRHVRPPIGSRRFIIGVGRVCSCRRDAWNCPLILAHVTISRLWLLQYAVEGSTGPLDRPHEHARVVRLTRIRRGPRNGRKPGQAPSGRILLGLDSKTALDLTWPSPLCDVADVVWWVEKKPICTFE